MSSYKKRLISVVSILDNLVVQSKGYNKYHPIGTPHICVENLARWGSDEILIQCFNRSKKNNGPDLRILKSIANFKNATPIIYSGGIRNKKDAIEVIKNGAERVVVGYSFFKNFDLGNLEEISDTIGRQSLILSLPTIIQKNKYFIYDYINNVNHSYDRLNFKILKNIISEIMVTDVINEGYYDKFNLDIIKAFKTINIPIIFFGGINSKKKIKKILNEKQASAIAVGNFLNFKEHSYQQLAKKKISKFRKSYYEKK